MRRLSTEEIYAGVPRERVEALLAFRRSHPVSIRTVGGVAWHYILTGGGPETILILGGAMSTPESSHSLMGRLEEDFRALAPSYPAYDTVGAFVEGLVGLLDALGVGRVHVYGHSLGAGVAHVLLRRHPAYVDKMVLSSFGLYNAQSLRRVSVFLGLFRLLPYTFVGGYYKRRMASLLPDRNPNERAFHLAYARDVLEMQHNKRSLMGQFVLLEDMFKHAERYRVHDPVAGEHVLIIQAADDSGFQPDEQAALRATYPGAHLCLFETGGHLAAAAHQEEHDRVLHAFLEKR